jgi:predicted NUDIX family NTP pyrophosphohydrolase
MPRRSAALLLYRRRDDRLEVLIGHMGGPFWARKDAGGWSIPKGEFEPGEEPLAAARREFTEELGSPPPEPANGAKHLELPDAKQSNGKIVTTFAVEGDFDASTMTSNLFELEWPRGSGKLQEFPELDRAEWHDVQVALGKVVKGQVPILEALREALREAVKPA